MATISWNSAVSGDFADAANWSGGTVPGSSDDAQIEQTGTYTVTSSADESVQSVTVGSDATLTIAGGTFTATLSAGGYDLSVGVGAAIDVEKGAILQSAPGGIYVQGSMTIAPGGELLIGGLDEAIAIAGGGTITLGGAGSEINGDLGVIGNYDTIDGAGTISMSSPDAEQFINEIASAVVDADESGGKLEFSGGIPILNYYGGTLEATDGGDLVLQGETITDEERPLNEAGVIEAIGAGSVVEFDNTFVYSGRIATADGGLIKTVGGVNTLDGFDGNLVAVDGSVEVSDGTELGLLIAIDNTGVISLAAAGHGATLTIESERDVKHQGLGTRTLVLTGDGAITLSDNTGNLIASASAADVVENDGETISGAGQIGGGAALSMLNEGVIEAMGENALVVSIAAGTLTNQSHGLIEAGGSGGLSFAGGTIKNSGLIEALDGSSVTFGAGATLSNSANGTLTGGVWEATAAGHGATLVLNGGAISTDAAKIVLSGVGSVFETDSTALESSLTTIASTGKLELLADRAWSSALGLDDNGSLQLGGGTFAAAGLTLGASGTLSGFGDVSSSLNNAGLIDGDGAGLTLAGSVANSGIISADRGTVDLTGSVTGTGTLKVYGSSMLEIGGSLASTEGVAFATGIHAVLKLDDPSAFASTIANLGLGDTIDLASTDATSAQISGDTLAITLMGGGTLNYSLADPGSNVRVVTASDGDGGTDLTLYKETAKTVARMSERMAGMAAPGGTPLPTHPPVGGPSLFLAGGVAHSS